MDPKDFQKEHKFPIDEFEVLIAIVNNYLVLEALNTITFQNYLLSLSDEDVFRLSQSYFTKTAELFEVLTSFFEETADGNQKTLARGQVLIKFKRKSLSFQFQVQFGEISQAKV